MSHKFFENKECEFYPCHAGVEELNCLFCFCPLYALGDSCGGNFVYLENGVKDCSGCLVPHQKKNYEYICGRFSEIAELCRKKEK